MKSLNASAMAVVASLLATGTPAAAAITIYNVSGTYVDGTVLSGSFRYDDSKADLDRYQNIDVSAGAYRGLSLTSSGGSGTNANGQYTFVDFSNPVTFDTVRLVVQTVDFDSLSGGLRTDALDTSASDLYISPTGTSAERFVALQSGTISAAVAAVPEPETWAMMVLGFALVGAATRRRHSVRVTYA